MKALKNQRRTRRKTNKKFTKKQRRKKKQTKSSTVRVSPKGSLFQIFPNFLSLFPEGPSCVSERARVAEKMWIFH
jgi:hypothetical protein